MNQPFIIESYYKELDELPSIHQSGGGGDCKSPRSKKI